MLTKRTTADFDPERRQHVRRFVVIASCSLLLTTGVTTALGAVWARDMREPRITLLGSGTHLSVLVSAGDARVLFVAGDDSEAFESALNRARFPTTRRLDVILFDGDAGALSQPSEALTHSARYIGFLEPPRVEQAAGVPDVPNVAVMRTPRRFRLGEEVTITIESVPAFADGRGNADTAWRATIVHDGTTVLLLSDGSAASRMMHNDAVSAVIVAGGEPRIVLRQIDARLAAFSAEALSGAELRQEVLPASNKASWAIRVFPGEAVRLALSPSGLRFDRRDAQSIRPGLESATPESAQ